MCCSLTFFLFPVEKTYVGLIFQDLDIKIKIVYIITTTYKIILLFCDIELKSLNNYKKNCDNVF